MVGGSSCYWSGPPPQGEEEEEEGQEVWLSRSCLSVRHRLGPDGGDGAPGTGLMEPTRAEAETP